MEKIDLDGLFERAIEAGEAAYAPYSQFRIGSAVLADDGTIYTGCNVENRTYGLSVCAEKVALLKAISEGRRSLIAMAIAALDSPIPVGPCGACRHIYSEFMSPDAIIRFGTLGNDRMDIALGDLLPYDSFTPEVADLIIPSLDLPSPQQSGEKYKSIYYHLRRAWKAERDEDHVTAQREYHNSAKAFKQARAADELDESEKQYLEFLEHGLVLRGINAENHFNLTSREQEVLIMLLSGRVPKQIAGKLNISYETSRFHIKNLYRKLGIQSRAELFDMYYSALTKRK
ncbi:cytidine deaminase [Treponema sp. OttesenSCG-928-L16]|nr:cytidine deaminase [Treponema sp. OttesenSCG-928-L16]